MEYVLIYALSDDIFLPKSLRSIFGRKPCTIYSMKLKFCAILLPLTWQSISREISGDLKNGILTIGQSVYSPHIMTVLHYNS